MAGTGTKGEILYVDCQSGCDIASWIAKEHGYSIKTALTLAAAREATSDSKSPFAAYVINLFGPPEIRLSNMDPIATAEKILLALEPAYRRITDFKKGGDLSKKLFLVDESPCRRDFEIAEALQIAKLYGSFTQPWPQDGSTYVSHPNKHAIELILEELARKD